MKRYLSLCLAALLVLALLPTMALADEYQVSKEEELVTAIQAIQDATSGATIKLTADIVVDDLSTENNRTVYEIKAKNVTIDGDGHTITVTNEQMEGEYQGPILFGFNGKGATGGTIKDLKIEVTYQGVKHAIQAYNGAKLTVNDVDVSGCLGYALLVNGSEVTVNGLTTSGNGSGGINVDLGDGVKTPADLTIEDATIEDPTSVYVEHNNTPDTPVTATINGGSFQKVKVEIPAEDTENTALTVSGGEFTTPPTEYVTGDETVASLGNKTYVGDAKEVAKKVEGAQSGQTITVLTGDLELTGVPAGVTVINQGGDRVTVNGTSLDKGDRYSKPTKPIAGVVVAGGQQEDEDEPEQSPSNTLRYAVICRTLNVRSGPGTEYSKLGTLSRGTLLDGELLSNGWVKFSYNGQTAYVSGMYVQSVDNGQLSVQCGTLNVRSGAGTSYSKIGKLYRGTYVKPLETQGNWYKIGYDGGYGWICADYVG